MRFENIVKMFIAEFCGWRELIICAWPNTFLGRSLRGFYWGKIYGLSYRPAVGRMARIYGGKEKITLGKNFSCGEYTEINACTSHGIYIGDDALFANGIYIRSGNHKFDCLNVPINQQGHDCAILQYQGREYSIVIEDDVWIGANVTILSGTKIGKGCVIAAGSVIPKKEFPPYSVIGGNPARVIKSRQKETSNLG